MMENYCKAVFIVDPIIVRDREHLHVKRNVIKFLAMTGQIERYKLKGFFKSFWRGKGK